MIVLVDDVNESHSFGFTDSLSKVTYNMKMLDGFLNQVNIGELLANSKDGLTTLFPLGRYINILKMKKDKSAMSMMLLDFRIEYSTIDTNFNDLFSENVVMQFKKLKYEMEDLYEDEADCVILSTTLEPPQE